MIGLLLVFGCTEPEVVEPVPRHIPGARAIRVEVALLDPESEVGLTLSIPGEVEGSEDVILGAALGGQVESVRVSKGQWVKRGQTIARIDAEIYGAQTVQAEARVEQAKMDLQRIEKMGDLAPQSQLTQARTALKVADSQLKAAAAQHSRAVIRAPFSGTLADVMASRGEFLGPGMPVARLVKLNPVAVSLAVPDRDVVALTPGMEATVRLAAVAKPLSGTVAHVGRAADLRTRSFPVEVKVDNPDGLILPGMIATVDLERSLPKGTLAIPQDWVVNRGKDQGVFVETDGFARWKPVELGPIVHDQVVVESGLSAGSRVVISGQRDLTDGVPLMVSREGVCCVRGRAVFGDD